MDESGGQTKISLVLNTGEMVAEGDGGGTCTNLDAGGVRHSKAGPDGHGNWLDTSSGHRDVLGTHDGMDTTTDARNTSVYVEIHETT